MTNGGPLVTVSVPCFNYAQYLEESIGSVVAQTYPNWEAYVVDDGSTEGDVAAEVERWGDERVRLVRQVNQGVAAARNAGVRAGTGPFVFPLDADDSIAPTCLEELVSWLDVHDEADSVFPDFDIVGGRSGQMQYSVRSTRELLLDQWVPGAGTLYRRTIFDAVDGYYEDRRISGNEDWEFWLAVAASTRGLRTGHVAAPLYRYRVHGGSLSGHLLRNDYDTREVLYGRHRALYDEYGLGRAFRAEGYRRSAVAELRNRKPLRAARRAIRGLALSPTAFLGGFSGRLRRSLARGT